jgi:hypothetical protein
MARSDTGDTRNRTQHKGLLLKLRSKRAISTVIATVIMINLALVTGILVYAWAQGMFGVWTGSNQIYFISRGEKMRESIAIVNVRYDPGYSGFELYLTVRNIGIRDVWIDSIRLNDTENIKNQPGILINAWDSDGTAYKIVDDIHLRVSSNGTFEYRLFVDDSITFAFQEQEVHVMKDGVPQSLDVGKLLSVVVVSTSGCKDTQIWRVSQ